MNTINLDSLTSPEVKSLCLSIDVDVILPLGAIEQHGPHLPLNVDVLIAEKVADLVASELVRHGLKIVVAPTFVYGDSSHHLGFAGTMSLHNESLVSSLRDLCHSILKSGFRRIYLLTGHAGNCDAMNQIENEFGKSQIIAVADWPSIRGKLHNAATEKLSLLPEVVGTHAGHFETSIMMLISPDKVRQNLIEVGVIGNPADIGAKLRSLGMQRVSENGVIGDPRSSSASAGKIYLDTLVDLHVEVILLQSRERV